MPDFDPRNRGSLWKNEDRTEDWHPPYKGVFVDENGVHYFVDMWGKKPDANPKAPDITFKIKRKDKQPEQASNETVAAPMATDFDDTIPFINAERGQI